MDGVAKKASAWRDRFVLRLIYMKGLPAYDTHETTSSGGKRSPGAPGSPAAEASSMIEKTMNNPRVALLVLQRGMSLEQIGRAFYLRASQTTTDSGGKKSFIDLADDEQTHYNLLKRQYESLARETGWVSLPEVKPVAINLARRLFPVERKDVEKAISVKSSDWDALLFGMDIEIKSFDLYRKAATQTVDRAGRRMFEWLAVQESGHFDVLMMRYDYLYGPVAWHP